MQATPIALDFVRKLAVDTGAVKPDTRLITEHNVDDPHAVIMMLYELISDYEKDY